MRVHGFLPLRFSAQLLRGCGVWALTLLCICATFHAPAAAGETAEGSWQSILETRRQWWSLQALNKPEIPTTKNASWPNHPIDRFVLAKLEDSGLEPAGPADAAILMRRLSLVLTGLPPSPAEVRQFVVEQARQPEKAYARLVQRLLDSPHFGEHWARHWMDVVRYAETHGYEWNHEIRDAWRYRDYLIRAFNADVPYDQLVREHIAGDLLKPPRVNRELGLSESVIGTAFWRFGELGHDDCVRFPEIRFDALDNQIDTLSKAFQAATVSCARCHDHKLDAISTTDYYALVGILESSRQVVQTLDSPSRIASQAKRLRTLKQEIREQLGKEWLAAIGQSHQTILVALEADRIANDDSPALSVFSKQLSREKVDLDDPAFVLQRVADLDTAQSVPRIWQQIKEEYYREQTARTQFNAENFEDWGAFCDGDLHGWRISGLGLSAKTGDRTTAFSGPGETLPPGHERPEVPCGPGEFTVALDGSTVVPAVLPAGIYTHLLSDRLNGTLQSPWIPTQRRYVSVQFQGGGLSMIRPVVDSCALNEYAGGELLYLDEAELQWKRFPTSAGPSHRSYVELTTKLDNARWPDRTGEAGTEDEAKLKSPHFWFGVTRAVLHDCEESPRPELSHVIKLFDRSDPESLSDVAVAYQSVCRKAVQVWMDGQATDDDVRWINWMVSVRLLPNSIKSNESLARLVHEYRDLEATIPQPRVVAAMADHGSGFASPLLRGGSPSELGPLVPRRYLEVIAASSRPLVTQGSGRRELAELIASPQNPLTVRVMVNRVWHHLFGAGIVRTTDDFGVLGERPSHPKLLDYEAGEFVRQGWSVKTLIRRIVTSRTFRQSSVPIAMAKRKDPENRLLHHYPVRRLDAEAIRDTILAVSGRLDRKLFGPSIHPYRKEPKEDRKLFAGPLDGDGRRSLYLKVTRMEGPKFLELFDLPNPMATRGSRDRTNVPAQALALLNDPFLMDQ